MKWTPKAKLIAGVGSVLAMLGFLSCAQKDAFYTNSARANLFTQSYVVEAYDFLWVLDNSHSMDPKRQYLADNMQSFLSTLNTHKAIDYQMAVTDIDFFSNAGGLISNSDGLTVVKSATSQDPAGDFASIVNSIQYSQTAFWEQGLIQAKLAIQNNGTQFMRNGVPLIVIFLTDDDDWSCQGMLDGESSCYGVEPENNPDVDLYDTGYFINFFSTLKAPQSTTTTLFPIVGTSDADCIVERVGMRYQEVAKQVGGDTVTGGLCPDTIAASLNNVALTLANRGVIFPLSYPATGLGIQVYVNNTLVPQSADNGYTFDAPTNSIVFNGDAIPGNGAQIEVTYQQ